MHHVTAQRRNLKMNIPKTGDLQHAANVVTYVVINQFWKEKTFAGLRRVGKKLYVTLKEIRKEEGK